MSAPRIGILSLDTRFPRIAGDVGNPDSYPFPVRIERVAGATPERVVHQRAEGLVEAFAAVGQRLAAEGCEALVTTCGFLSLRQSELAAALPVPVATSALMQLPLIQQMLPAGRITGIVTASERSLTPAHLTGVGADPQTPIVGVEEGGAFSATFVGNGDRLDVAAARTEVVAAALRLVATQPRLGAILLECANMGPYARDVQHATHLPVFDMVGLVRWLHQALDQPAYL
ncbi:MAG TPA: aspartate/glutamate racemase family protein [Beijerinckiaceae bacterium]|nr:aspartate/glutamate racemase family protein [Beijerinckiaceae bacterium]